MSPAADMTLTSPSRRRHRARRRVRRRGMPTGTLLSRPAGVASLGPEYQSPEARARFPHRAGWPRIENVMGHRSDKRAARPVDARSAGSAAFALIALAGRGAAPG